MRVRGMPVLSLSSPDLPSPSPPRSRPLLPGSAFWLTRPSISIDVPCQASAEASPHAVACTVGRQRQSASMRKQEVSWQLVCRLCFPFAPFSLRDGFPVLHRNVPRCLSGTPSTHVFFTLFYEFIFFPMPLSPAQISAGCGIDVGDGAEDGRERNLCVSVHTWGVQREGRPRACVRPGSKRGWGAKVS